MGIGFVRRHGALVAVGGTALVVAAAGGATAQSLIDGGTIAPGTVGARQIGEDAVQSRHIHPDAVQAKHLAPGAVTGPAIAAGAVNRAKIGDLAVGRDQIGGGAVSRAKIASGAVDAPQIAPGAVTRSKLAAEARVPRLVTRFVHQDVPMGTQATIQAACAAGETLVAGGFGGLPTTQSASGGQVSVLANRPEPDVQTSTPVAWLVIVDNHSTSLAQATAYAVCAQT